MWFNWIHCWINNYKQYCPWDSGTSPNHISTIVLHSWYEKVIVCLCLRQRYMLLLQPKTFVFDSSVYSSLFQTAGSLAVCSLSNFGFALMLSKVFPGMPPMPVKCVTFRHMIFDTNRCGFTCMMMNLYFFLHCKRPAFMFLGACQSWTNWQSSEISTTFR